MSMQSSVATWKRDEIAHLQRFQKKLSYSPTNFGRVRAYVEVLSGKAKMCDQQP